MGSRDWSFFVYIDENGDDGFKFPPHIGGKGSSIWLVLSAAVFKAHNEADQVKCVDRARAVLGRNPLQPLHFTDLRHEQKIAYAREVGNADFLATNIAIYKPNITERTTFSKKSVLYNYAGKLLLERVSWICAKRYWGRIKGDGSRFGFSLTPLAGSLTTSSKETAWS